MMRRKADGEWMHQAPVGFKLVKNESGRITLEKDPDSYQMLVEAKSLQEKGLSNGQIAKILHVLGYRSKRGGKLSRTTVWRMIQRSHAD